LNYILIGKVEQVHGKAGYVLLNSFSDFLKQFCKLQKVYLDFWGDKKNFCVQDVKDINGRLAVKFKKFDSVRDCQVLIGREIYIEEKDKVNLPDNQFFAHELIGSEVIIEKESYGTVTDVITGKANDVLVITANDKEKLIPLVLNFIESFDAAKKKLILNISLGYLNEDED
jgi:16S rRNA processing protein RimM